MRTIEVIVPRSPLLSPVALWFYFSLLLIVVLLFILYKRKSRYEMRKKSGEEQ
jgi:membrane protein implicated in regulation of membrane protease activity